MTNDKITIIGIAGGTGSGKTTVVKKIVETLPPHHVAVVPLDSYYNDTSHMTEEERRAINFDHPDAFDWKLLIKQINELREGRAIEQPTYSYLKCNREKETIHVEPKPVIIVEGIMTLLNKRLRDMMDLRIFVDCDPRRAPHTQHSARHHRPRTHRLHGCRPLSEGAQADARAVHRTYKALRSYYHTRGWRQSERHQHGVQVHRKHC